MANFKINLKATNLDLNFEIKKFVDQKVGTIKKFLKLSSEDDVVIDCEVGRTKKGQHTGDIFRAELNALVHGKLIRTESVRDRLFVAVEDAVEEMISRVKKAKEKQTDLYKRGAKKIKKIFREE